VDGEKEAINGDLMKISTWTITPKVISNNSNEID
jgi:hypothetical protein